MKARCLYALTGALSVACGVPSQYARSWESIHQDTFLPGYHEFRGERDGTEDGYIVMSYGVPDGVPAQQAVGEVKRLVQSRYPCYAVLKETATDLVLRCAGGRSRNGAMWDEEYRVLLQPGRRRLVVLVLDSVRRQRYKQFATILEEFRES